MRRILIVVIVLLCATLVQSTLLADCGVFFKSYGRSYGYATNYKAAYVAPVVVAPIYYTPAETLQLAAKKTHFVRTDEEYQRFLQFKAYEAGFTAAAVQRAQTAAQFPQQYSQQSGVVGGNAGAVGAHVAPTVNSSAPPLPVQQNQQSQQSYTTPPIKSLIVHYCANCHGKELDTPKGGMYIDPTVSLSGDGIIEILRRMRLPDNDPDVMPPAPVKLQPEEKGAILEELLQLHAKGPTR